MVARTLYIQVLEVLSVNHLQLNVVVCVVRRETAAVWFIVRCVLWKPGFAFEKPLICVINIPAGVFINKFIRCFQELVLFFQFRKVIFLILADRKCFLILGIVFLALMQIIITYKTGILNLLVNIRLLFARNKLQDYTVIPDAFAIRLQGIILPFNDIETAFSATELKSTVRQLFDSDW